jgi:hypothetical protein
MARRQVLEVTCDRCGRTETQDASEGDNSSPSNELSVTFHGKSVEYTDLCKKCRSAVDRYFAQMTKQPAADERVVEELPEKKKRGLLQSVRSGS